MIFYLFSCHCLRQSVLRKALLLYWGIPAAASGSAGQAPTMLAVCHHHRDCIYPTGSLHHAAPRPFVQLDICTSISIPTNFKSMFVWTTDEPNHPVPHRTAFYTLRVLDDNTSSSSNIRRSGRICHDRLR